MKSIDAITLMVSLLLLVGGCTGLRRAETTSVAADTGEGRSVWDAGTAEPKSEPAESYLKRHGFAVLTFRAICDDFGQVSVVGEIKNVGSASRGVELQAALRDTDGRVVAVGHFCPAANRNIVPGETWPFTYSFGRQEDAVEAELRIVGAFRTMGTLNTASTMR